MIGNKENKGLRGKIRMAALLLCLGWSVGAQEPDSVRRIPPVGVAVLASDKSELENGIAALGKEIEALQGQYREKPTQRGLIPDVQIFHNAARYALTYNEFFNEREIPVAKEMIKVGLERAKQLREGTAPWTAATGLVVRGYVSKIDGSVQPYGLVIPASVRPDSAQKVRLDCWFHGRGETLSELNFLNDRMRNNGEFVPRDAIVLHLYGRYCNANKFAGEVDLFEAMDSVKSRYNIDPNRVVIRGFSMGGAACWQFAAHFPGEWAAAAPGAGFAESVEFLRIKKDEMPPWYEQKLWHLYDATDYAANLANLPTVAYSGEKDGQKQAADIMRRFMTPENIPLTEVIGVNAGHFYTPEARTEINKRLDAIAVAGRDPMPKHLHFTTWTLRYNTLRWLKLDGLETHWERAKVIADLDPAGITLKTQNVSAFTIAMEAGHCPFPAGRKAKIRINGNTLDLPYPNSDRSLNVSFRKIGGGWKAIVTPEDGTLRKIQGLQGPIDDAFYDSFLMVTPTGSPLNSTVGEWAAKEQEHAVTHWRRQFRGEARVKTDAEITDADIAASNLILWGDPKSNRVLARIADKLPIKWDTQGVRLGDRTYNTDSHVPVFIYPNPLNPKKYVVINSGFTFREFAYLNNAQQTPKLPDFAVIDVRVPANSRTPGGIVEAGFFGEQWEFLAKIQNGRTK